MRVNLDSGLRRLAVFATHPIQYQAPIWRRLAQAPGLEVVVHYFSDHSIRGGIDAEFGLGVSWDVDLLGGYKSIFINRNADLARPSQIRIADPDAVFRDRAFDWVLISGYTHRFERQVIGWKRRFGYRIVMRGEFSDEARVSHTGGTYTHLHAHARDAYLRWFYRRVDSFGVAGTAAKRHLDRLGVPADTQFASPYNVDTDLFERQFMSLDRKACRNVLGIGDGQFVILFSGKFIPRKAPELLLEAVSRIPKIEGVVAILIGEGELRSEIERRFRPIMADNLILPGFINQSQLGRYFRAADVFVMPSEFETWGLAVNEAMQFGLPVVVSDRVGCRHDLVIPGVTGDIFPSGDANRLAGILEGMRNPALRERLGDNCLNHIKGYSTRCASDGLLNALR